MDELIHRSQRGHVRVLFRTRFGSLHYPAPAQHVVKRNRPASTDQLQALLVINGVTSLVGVDKGEIEMPAFPGCNQAIERLASRRDSKIDLAADTGFSPIPPCDLGLLFADVTRHDMAVGRQGQRHRE